MLNNLSVQNRVSEVNWKKHCFPTTLLVIGIEASARFSRGGSFATQDLYIKCLVTGPEQLFRHDFANQDFYREF